MNHLVIFDVDGTLCDTCGVDSDCFWTAAAEILGSPEGQLSWEAFPLVTDSGIAEAMWQRHVGRSPTADDVEALVARFEAKLQQVWTTTPTRFRSIPGASQLLTHLGDRRVPFCIATGGWSRSAKLKLRAADLPTEHLLASADDSPHRTEIFRLAHARALSSLVASPTRTILVGDGTWDVKVAAELGWSFVGIGQGQREAELRAAGAAVVVPDYEDLDRVVDAICV
jgi:phosphoglycolate phosphatase-like HAD superfamily hydrolase